MTDQQIIDALHTENTKLYSMVFTMEKNLREIQEQATNINHITQELVKENISLIKQLEESKQQVQMKKEDFEHAMIQLRYDRKIIADLKKELEVSNKKVQRYKFKNF